MMKRMLILIAGMVLLMPISALRGEAPSTESPSPPAQEQPSSPSSVTVIPPAQEQPQSPPPVTTSPPAQEQTPSPPSVTASPPEKEDSDATITSEDVLGAQKTLEDMPLAPDAAPKLDTRISLDLRNIDVLDILKFLAIKSNLNIVGGQGIKGTVNLLLKDVKIGDAIDIILSVSRLAYSIDGNVMRVMIEEEYKALYGKEFYDKRETRIIQLKYASAKNVGAILEGTKSSIGRIVYNESTGTVVMTDTPEKIKEMEEIIHHEELPNVVRLPPTATEVFDLQYADAEKMKEKIAEALTKDMGKVYVDATSNRLVVSDLPYKVEEIRKLIQAFDTKTREVFIEAKIIQISLSDEFKAGVDWKNLGGHFVEKFPLSLTSFGQMTVGSITETTTASTAGVTTSTLSGSGVILKFLEEFGSVHVLSTPQISAIDGQEARIMVGTREAYTTSSITQSQATTTTAQQVTFVDVGVNLKVTPKINSDGYVTMKIRPEVSSVNRFLTTPQGDQIPIVESTNAETTVMVKNGETVLIAGLMTTQRKKNRSGVPILSRIPILGIPFRSTQDESTNTELSVLLTPHVMSGEGVLPGTLPSVAQVTIPSEENKTQLREKSEDQVKKKEKKKRQRRRRGERPGEW